MKEVLNGLVGQRVKIRLREKSAGDGVDSVAGALQASDDQRVRVIGDNGVQYAVPIDNIAALGQHM